MAKSYVYLRNGERNVQKSNVSDKCILKQTFVTIVYFVDYEWVYLNSL